MLDYALEIQIMKLLVRSLFENPLATKGLHMANISIQPNAYLLYNMVKCKTN